MLLHIGSVFCELFILPPSMYMLPMVVPSPFPTFHPLYRERQLYKGATPSDIWLHMIWGCLHSWGCNDFSNFSFLGHLRQGRILLPTHKLMYVYRMLLSTNYVIGPLSWLIKSRPWHAWYPWFKLCSCRNYIKVSTIFKQRLQNNQNNPILKKNEIQPCIEMMAKHVIDGKKFYIGFFHIIPYFSTKKYY